MQGRKEGRTGEEAGHGKLAREGKKDGQNKVGRRDTPTECGNKKWAVKIKD